ncbi:MAG: hypothetical protein UT55_C0001G0023 [Candidatus Peregrinibacteria bacterium GW2011_GWE2_39_6]|nr:MAG: hypothetical protein UT55_C0001G0023 [Candidatus Peregrinibacteria bacterium GW2011_GWE2_39_6]
MLNLDIDILELRNRLRAVQCARLIRQTKKAPNGTPPPDINTVLSTVLEELSSDAAEIPELEGDQTANQRQIAEKKAEAAREKEAAREAARASAEAARQATNNSTSNGSNLARTGLAEGAAQGFFSELMRRFLDYLEKSRRRNLPPGPPTS